MNLLIAIGAIFLGATAPVTVRMADKSTLDGNLTAIAGGQITIDVKGESVTLNQSQVTKIEGLASNSAPSTPPVTDIVVGLRGGSELKCESISSDGKTVSLTLAGGATLDVAPAQIAWCLLQPLTPATQSQWQAILDLQATADQLILKRSEDAIDKIGGVIKSIDQERVNFDFDGQAVPAPRTKLLGFTFLSNESSQPPAPTAVVYDRFGSFYNSIDLAFDSKSNDSPQLTIRTSKNMTIDLDIAKVAEIDYSAGNLKHLVDVNVLASDWQGVGYPGDMQLAKKLFGFQIRKDSRGASYDLESRGASTATYRVPAPFNRFQTVVYAANSGNVAADMSIEVRQDDELLYRETLQPDSKPLVIDIPVKTGKRVTISTAPTESRSFAGISIWQQPRFSR